MEVQQRIRRVIRLLVDLKARQPQSSKHLAQRFGVSERTVFRDLQVLKSSGVSIEFDRKQQGYRLDSEIMTVRELAITEDDIATLVTAAELSVVRSWSTLARPLERIIAKLKLLDGVQSRHRVLKMEEEFLLQNVPRYAQAVCRKALRVVLAAAHDKTSIDIDYRTTVEDGLRRLRVHPHFLSIAVDRQQAQLVGASQDQAWGTYNLENIIRARPINTDSAESYENVVCDSKS